MGHEDSIVSTFLACAIILVFAIKFLEGLNSGQKLDLNNLELFQVHEYEQPVVTATISTATSRSKPKTKKKKKHKPLQKQKPEPKPEQKRNSRGYTDLQQDCFDALKSLGIKPVKERQFIINQTFNNHDPKTIQDFIKLALGK